MTVEQVKKIWSQTRVVATAAVTWLTIAAVIIQSVIAQVGADWPAVAEYGSRALIVITGVVAVIRRVAPVAKTDRGVLP